MTKKLSSVIASVAMLLNVATPAFASSELIMVGNGADSDNDIQITNSSTTIVGQNNQSNIVNDINVDSETGENEANKNTGGNVSISTGDSDVLVKAKNQANTNVADVENCDCDTDTDVLIEGNGADSDNDVRLKKDSSTQVYQDNKANIVNDVDVDSETGENEAEKNTGGDVEIKTGDSWVGVALKTAANSNSAKVGGNGSGSGSLSARILGNGADSDNDIKLTLDREVLLTQYNKAYVKNDVDVDSETGENEAEKNTGGEVFIDTGDSDVAVIIDNMVNFNAADIDCGCIMDVLAKIAGNGYDSDNDIRATLEDDLTVWQDNSCGAHFMPRVLGFFDKEFGGYGKPCLDNDVDVDSETGENEAEENTGSVMGGDPSVTTGDSDVEVEVENTSNANIYGDADPMDWHDEGVNVNVSFDLHALLSALLGL